MSYFSEWNERFEDDDQNRLTAFANTYYELEQEAYRRMLEAYPDAKLSGTADELQEHYGFDGNMVIFAGFLDGIRDSLNEPILDLEELTEASELKLDIDYEKLLYNMHGAGAKWLFNLDAWDNVLTPERQKEITREFNRDHIATSNKVGRNDPCPCGSGKKYKNCHGKPGADLSELAPIED